YSVPASRGAFLARPIEDEFGYFQQLLVIGKERGYLLYDEINDSLPPDVLSSQEIDDLLALLERQGIEIHDDLTAANAARAATAGDAPEAGHKEEFAADSDLDLSVGEDSKSQDPVRLYLREMGSVPLLTREGEVALAKRIEQGNVRVMKSVTRSPIVVKELISVAAALRQGDRSIKEVVQFPDEEITEEKIARKTSQTLRQIDAIALLYETALRQAEKFAATPKSKRQSYVRAKWALARSRVRISLAIRGIPFHWHERKRLVDHFRAFLERLHTLERDVRRLQRRVDLAHGEVAAEARKQLRSNRAALNEMALSSHTDLIALKRTLTVIQRGEAQAQQARTIRVPVHMIEVINKLTRCTRQLVQELGREPTSEELAMRMDVTIEKVRSTRKIAQTPISFETPIGEEEESHLGDFIEDKA